MIPLKKKLISRIDFILNTNSNSKLTINGNSSICASVPLTTNGDIGIASTKETAKTAKTTVAIIDIILTFMFLLSTTN